MKINISSLNISLFKNPIKSGYINLINNVNTTIVNGEAIFNLLFSICNETNKIANISEIIGYAHKDDGAGYRKRIFGK